MNAPTIIIALIVLAVFAAIIARGVHNWKSGKSGCSCGGDCGACHGACHSKGKIPERGYGKLSVSPFRYEGQNMELRESHLRYLLGAAGKSGGPVLYV